MEAPPPARAIVRQHLSRRGGKTFFYFISAERAGTWPACPRMCLVGLGEDLPGLGLLGHGAQSVAPLLEGGVGEHAAASNEAVGAGVAALGDGPVRLNAAVDLNGGRAGAERYFVTDGGAVENRGLLSALLALLAEVGPMADGAGLPKFKVLVTEASGTSIAYGEDRGIGAVGSAKRQMANKLVAALGKVLEGEWRRVGGEGVSFEIVYLPMPEVLRTGFGTHWQLPAKVTLRDPETWFRDSSWLKFWKRKPETLTLKRDQLEWLIDELLARERTPYRPGEEEEKLWRWLTTGAHGDPRCALFKAVGGQAEGCD